MIKELKYSWPHLPIINLVFSHWGCAYWHFFDVRDYDDYCMHCELKERHPWRFKMFKLFCDIDAKITKLFDKNNHINDEVPF